MGFVVMVVFWFAAGFTIRSWWVVLGPVVVGGAVLAGVELIPDLEQRRIGDLLLYLGGDQEFWFLSFLFGVPFFALAAGLGYQLREHLQPRRVAQTPH